ncbi:MAG: toll/interleukin-1 receptor domain-containing protein, partial [Ktedonobacteraceae bacterium]|nr:toll/interleukin-1 receptor domain-containing protein [Ktedonobacteraceae bacterium]
AGIAKARVPLVTALTNKFIHEREADLEQWRIDIGQAGELTYTILAGSTRWLTETQVRQYVDTPDMKIGHGLTTLCYHGLAVHDGTWSKYRSVGELFKRWYQKNILPSSDISSALITPSQDTSNKEYGTGSRKGPSSTNSVLKTHKPVRNRAFISYSHKDKRYLHELTTHLAPYVQSEVVDVWDDTQIPPGSKWREEIEKALQSAKVAILLVSAEFLASDFIMNFELPSLLAASEQEGIIFLSVLLRPCAFTNIDIGQFQSVNMPSTPLSKMKRAKRDEVWSKVAEFVKEALSKAE